MADDHDPKAQSSGEVSRRDFVALSVAAGIALAAGKASAAEVPVVETTVQIKTPDGTCDAAFIHPETGAHPGVVIWPDAFGLRPSMRDIGKRIAAEGYSVLVPNPFYRLAKAPVFDNPSKFDFTNQADMAKLTPLMASINAAGAAERDAIAFVTFLDAQPQVDQREEDRHNGLLHGRSARRQDTGGRAKSGRRRRFVPRGRPRHGSAKQSAPACAKDQSPHVFRHRLQRRHAPARREGQIEGSIRRGARAGRDRGVFGCICTDGACRTCRFRTASRSTTNRTRSVRGRSWWRCIRPRSSSYWPVSVSLEEPANTVRPSPRMTDRAFASGEPSFAR